MVDKTVKDSACPCESGETFRNCCAPFLVRAAQAPTAEALMRSRYSAYATGNEDYLLYTWHPATAPADLNLEDDQRWIGLKITDTKLGGAGDDEGEVAFVARYKIAGKGHRLQERSHFQRLGGRWVYVGGVVS